MSFCLLKNIISNPYYLSQGFFTLPFPSFVLYRCKRIYISKASSLFNTLHKKLTQMLFFRQHRHPLLLQLLFLLLLTLPWTTASADGTPEAMLRMGSATESATAAQQEMNSWLEEKEELLQSIQDARLEREHLRYQEKKYLFQVKKEQEILSELDREQQEMERMLFQLEPELAARVDTLESFIQADIPFLKPEREERVTMLQNSLMDHRLPLSVKLQRILEAYLIEAGYGRNVETVIRSIDLNGRERTVRVFRLGRLGLYFLSTDNSTAGRWNRDRATWELLPSSMIRTLNTAMDICERKRAAEMVNLPVGRP